MNHEQLKNVARPYGVSVSVVPPEMYGREGILELWAEGETVIGSLFLLDQNKVRLRKPGHGWQEGDFATAIAMALRCSSCVGEILPATIRSLSILIV